MKRLFILGNWKANKTIVEASNWLQVFSSKFTQTPLNLEIILCPAFHHLPLFSEAKLPVSLGVQDVSQFASGAFTGEISAPMLKGLVTYALLGHSERRNKLGETDEIICQKVVQCLSNGIIPIVCVSELSQVEKLKILIPKFFEKGMLLYEPLSAIGTGQADSPENANTMSIKITDVLGRLPVLYGGSVVPENAGSFMKQEFISGVGVGGASLDAEKFGQLIISAAS